MSKYENYSEVAQHYDTTRQPIGGEILLAALALARQSGAPFRLLDAGCGTGAYAHLVLPHVDRLEAIDINPGMLFVAQQKLADGAKDCHVAFHQGSIESLPFAADHFDGVMFNQVLHHLETGGDGGFSGHRSALAEAHRVLRPGGVVSVNCCSHEQLRQGFWFMHLIPTALEELFGRCIPATELEVMLGELGFTVEGRFVPLDGVLQGAAYADAEGPLKPEWRKTDSSWTLAPAAEIAAAEAKIRELRETGGLDGYLAESDAQRRQVGQTTFFVARKI